MSNLNLQDLRENYTKGGIRVAGMHPDPFAQLQEWLQVAADHQIPDANAMTLATADKNGVVSSRTLLLKGIVNGKLQFFTNYQSKKARDLAENPHASITILWKELERQICIRGTVKKTSREVSESYFKSRPYGSRIGAWVSEKQSSRIGVRSTLEKRELALRDRFPDDATREAVPCPDFWGGYKLTPTYLEFWQGRECRLHDRLRYLAAGEKWNLERLNP